jgi:GNAT superfamily N-acetyltransferase
METRPVTLDDASAIHALTRRWESHWNAPLVTPLHEVTEELTAPFIDLNRDTLGYWDDGRMVAYGRIWHRPSGEQQERAYMQGFVDPEYRRRGIGRELMTWQVETGTAILSAIDNDLPKYLRADEWDWIEESHRMYRRFGLEPVRYFTEMLKELDGEVAIDVLDGVRIAEYDRSLDAAALAAMNSSFADHWGSTHTDLESYLHRLSGEGTRLDLSFLALSDGDVIGLSLNAHFPEDEELLGRRDGWIETLGVVKEWRKKGVATALLQASFNAFVGEGFTHAALGVDTENPNAALKLYTNQGFQPTHRSITSQKAIESA